MKVECDGCGWRRHDVRSVGRDANGDPDAPDLCFVCRAELVRGKVYSRMKRRYIPKWMFCIECGQELDSYAQCENRRCCEWRGLAYDYAIPIIRHSYTVLRVRRM